MHEIDEVDADARCQLLSAGSQVADRTRRPDWAFGMRRHALIVAAAVALVATLVACGGGGSAEPGASTDIGSSPPGTAPAPTSDTPDPHTASFEALRAVYDKLPHTSPASDATALLAAVQGLADVRASGIEVAGNVWLTFNDGIPAVITTRPMRNNDTNAGLEPPAAQSSRMHALDAKLPGSKQAFLLEATGFGVTTYGHSRINTWLTDQGFNVSMIEGQVGPEAFRTIRNASVLGLSTHGGVGVVDGKPTFIMSTGLDATVQNLFAYRAELQTQQMGFIIITDPPDLPSKAIPLGNYWAAKLFITPKFVRNNMTFADGSVVYMGVCESFKPIAQDMQQAFLDVHASVVLGWDDEIVAGYTAASEAFLFDRLLSANSYERYRIDPGNRPFPVHDVLADMETRQRVLTQFPDDYPTGDARTLAAGSNRYETGAGIARLHAKFAKGYEGVSLVPSITGLRIDNVLDQLILSGNFGDGPGKGGDARTVTLAGNALNVLSWSGATIVTNMVPKEGPGSAGKLVVNVDGAKSNPAWINQWNGVVVRNYTPADGRPGDGTGTATTSLQCTVNLRGSATGFRAEPSGPPKLFATTDEAVVGTGDCMWDAYGTDNRPTYTNAYAVAGAKGLPWVNPPQRALAPSFARYAWVSASINAGRADFTMLGGVNPSDGGGLLQTFRRKTDGASSQSVSPFSSSGNTDNVTAALFGDDDSLLAGSAQQTLNFLTWGGSTASQRPDPSNYSR